jgi:murein DD-endopeptidase MepM/ murein hydrolase activator NlpD
VSSPKYQGRHYAGRHRNSGLRARLPRAFSSSLVLPTAAALALVVTATGATVAESAPVTLDLSGQQTSIARTEQVSDKATATEIAARRQASSRQTAALQARVEAQARAARSAKRKAAQAAAARAKAAAARAKAERQSKRWVTAIHTGRMTSGFGPRWGKTHDGLDIGAATGTPVYAMSKGTVIMSDNVSSFGNKVEIRYWNGTVSWYGHLSRRDVRTGDTVMPGERVGLVGNTGHSFGSHLHLEIHPTGGDKPTNPYPWLKAKGILVG